jgi:hypothetical protein
MGHRVETVASRLILLSLLDFFTSFGWKLHTSIDINQGHEGRWFFVEIINKKITLTSTYTYC